MTPNNPEQNKPELVNTKKVEPCDKCSSFTYTLMDSNGSRFCGKCKKPKKAMPPPTEVEVVENLQTVLEELSEPPEPWELEFEEAKKSFIIYHTYKNGASEYKTVEVDWESFEKFIKTQRQAEYERGKREEIIQLGKAAAGCRHFERKFNKPSHVMFGDWRSGKEFPNVEYNEWVLAYLQIHHLQLQIPSQTHETIKSFEKVLIKQIEDDQAGGWDNTADGLTIALQLLQEFLTKPSSD